MSETGRLHARVFGGVQGVGFRLFVQQRGRILGLAGYVRNCEDGSVEVTAEGEKSQLHILLGELNIGPRSSVVERVDYNFEEPAGSFRGFTIQ
jgi:acylphosphatase